MRRVILAIAACTETSANQVTAAPPDIGNLNPQLTPEMFSPKPSGPLQVMREAKAPVEQTKTKLSEIMRPRILKFKHTARVAVSFQPAAHKHLSRFRQV